MTNTTIKTTLEDAQRWIAQYWPLPSFITVNPLWEDIAQPFLEVMKTYDTLSFGLRYDFYQAQYPEHITEDDLHAAIEKVLGKQPPKNRQAIVTELLAAQDTTETRSTLLYSEQCPEHDFTPPTRQIQETCYAFLRDFFSQPAGEHNLLAQWQQQFPTSHPTPERHIATALDQLGIPASHHVAYLRQIYRQVYGWASFIKWLVHHPKHPWFQHQACLETLLIMWLDQEVALQAHTGHVYEAPVLTDGTQHERDCQYRLIWQIAYERPYHAHLLNQLSTTAPQRKTPDAQLVFCIDVRSEAMRRHIEAQGNYETFGIAGFFGFAFQMDHPEEASQLQCPAIVDPGFTFHCQAEQRAWLMQLFPVWQACLKEAKNALLSPFFLFELVGLWLLPTLLSKTFLPSAHKHHTHVPKGLDTWQPNFDDPQTPIDFDNALEAAHGLLATIGLTQRFAETVVIVGHQSHSRNNAFAASLDCGACGGNGGIPNAMIACAVLNHPGIRQGLAERGITIPEATHFIAGCHHTSTCELELFTTRQLMPLRKDLMQATQHLTQEQQDRLPMKRNLVSRAQDWAELIPELGLANNAAMVIGPRSLTEKAHLEQRVFLQSYDADLDPDGNVLEGILCAPMVVAHWINSQYYFSTVCPEVFGAGNKAIHNVIPGIGVMEGNLSDLKVGLPEQSVRFRDQQLHEPRRLFVVIAAPEARVNAIFAKHTHLAQLREGGWLTIHILDSTQKI